MTFRPLSPFRPFDPFKYGTRTLASQVRALFANGEQGAIYGTDFSTLFQDSAGTIPVTAVEQQVGYRLDMSGRGNHLVQATATKRAYVSRRVNLLTKTEDFADVAWTKVGANVVSDALSTADKIVATAADSAHGFTYSFVLESQREYVFRVVLTADQYKGIVLNVGGTAYTAINLETSTVTTSVNSGATSGAIGNVRQLVDGRYECSFRFTFTAATTTSSFRVYTSNSATVATNVPIFIGDGVSGVYIWSASLTLAIDSHLPYQRVNTDTDYDADPAKFPTLERYDGIDDSASSSTGGGGTAGFFFSSAITVSGGAGTNRVLFSDAGANTGYIVRINASNQLELAAGNGTTYTTVASVATLTAPVNAVVQAWDDGTNLNVRINDGAVASVARPTVSAGTAGYTIGQDNGASSGSFNGREYGVVYRKDSGLTADQRDQVRRYQLQQARFV